MPMNGDELLLKLLVSETEIYDSESSFLISSMRYGSTLFTSFSAARKAALDGMALFFSYPS